MQLLTFCEACNGSGISARICSECEGVGTIGPCTCDLCRGAGVFEEDCDECDGEGILANCNLEVV